MYACVNFCCVRLPCGERVGLPSLKMAVSGRWSSKMRRSPTAACTNVRLTPTKQKRKYRFNVSTTFSYVICKVLALPCTNFSRSDVSDMNRFNKKLKDTTGIEREKVVLDVELQDQTAPAEWKFNGKPIVPSDRCVLKCIVSQLGFRFKSNYWYRTVFFVFFCQDRD